jgi:uncharacterized OB-fold protein
MAHNISIPLHLELAYSHGLGALTPYFEGLLRGEAVASRCPRCGKAWCPPALACPDDGAATAWTPLAGTGTLLSATATALTLPISGQSRSCVLGLVRLDGAQNAMLARIDLAEPAAAPGTRLRIARAPGEWPHPAQAVHFIRP